MCEHCHCIPHLQGCPMEPEPPSVFICSGCGENIYDGDEYFDIMGEQFCESCMREARGIAEYDPY